MPTSYPDLTHFSNDPDDAWTLPGRYYYDEAVYADELELIFYQNWQYVCHISQLKTPGRYVVRDIGSQSVVILCDAHGEIRGFHNVCQHRAHRLLEGEGHVREAITCPYHAWRYDLDGRLRFARGSDKMKNFPHDSIRLQPVRVDTLCGFVFANLDADAPAMAERYDGLEAEILALAPDAPNLVRAHTHHYPLAANWKNSIENYSECYHCPNRHPSLVEAALDISRYTIKVYPGYHRHITGDVGDQQGYAITHEGNGSGHEFGSWFVWPNMVFEVYPGGNLTVFHHAPAGAEQTIQETEWYFSAETPTHAEQEVIDFVHIVRLEDIPICESVQRGLHSKGYRQGRLIVDQDHTDVSEHAVQDFQRQVTSALGADRQPA